MFLKISGSIFHNEIARDKTDFCIEQDLAECSTKNAANLFCVKIIKFINMLLKKVKNQEKFKSFSLLNTPDN